MVIGTTVIPQ